MEINKWFRHKRRKHPIRYDEHGKSGRARCFESFAEQTPISEIVEQTGLSLHTVQRYHVQWKKNPEFETQYAYAKELFRKNAPDRDKNIELFSQVCKIPKEEFEKILVQPHGLRRLMKGLLYLPAHADKDHTLHVVLTVAMAISDYLDNNEGKLEDVLFAFRYLMNTNRTNRKEEEKYIQQENKTIAFTRKILEASVAQEQQEGVKLDRLSEDEINQMLRFGKLSYTKKAEKIYWQHIGEYMATGLTKEQAREKYYQDLVDAGHLDVAEKLREYQNMVHPLKDNTEISPQKPTVSDDTDEKPQALDDH